MRWASALWLFVSACNQVFELDATALVDARYFDVGIDAPFTCPAIGETPAFAVNLTQVVFQQADQYTTSPTTKRAIGIYSQFVLEGPVDGPMVEQSGFNSIGCLACAEVTVPRITPEGDGIFALRRGQTQLYAHLVLYRPESENMWTGAVDLGELQYYWISSVTRGPTRRLVADDNQKFAEYDVTDAGGLTPVGTYAPGDLGVMQMRSPMLTADGLRMLFVVVGPNGTASTHMSDRASLGAKFGPARPLPGVPAYDGAYMLEDCSRVYVSGLGAVFYAPRM